MRRLHIYLPILTIARLSQRATQSLNGVSSYPIGHGLLFFRKMTFILRQPLYTGLFMCYFSILSQNKSTNANDLILISEASYQNNLDRIITETSLFIWTVYMPYFPDIYEQTDILSFPFYNISKLEDQIYMQSVSGRKVKV